MTARCVSAALLIIALLMATGASAQVAPRLEVSGQSVIAIIDNNGDGPDSGDCQFMAFLSSIQTNPPSAMVDIVGSQTNSPMLRACQLSFQGEVGKGTDSSSNFVTANILGALGPPGFKMPGSLPFFAELVDETPNPDISTPVMLSEVRDYAIVGGARGVLCSANGSPAAQVQLPGGPSLLVDLSLFPNAMNPMFLRVPGLPFELASGGFQMLNAFIPVTSTGHITVASSQAPSMLSVDINLMMLAQCAAGHQAPTASEMGLIVLALALLALGTFALSRRDAFARSVCF